MCNILIYRITYIITIIKDEDCVKITCQLNKLEHHVILARDYNSYLFYPPQYDFHKLFNNY